VATQSPQAHPATTEEMRARIGVESPPRVSPPVDKSLIRIWAISLAWPEPPDPLYWDEEYAKKTRFGGIIAPPYFNPFAYQMTPERVLKSLVYVKLIKLGKEAFEEERKRAAEDRMKVKNK